MDTVYSEGLHFRFVRYCLLSLPVCRGLSILLFMTFGQSLTALRLPLEPKVSRALSVLILDLQMVNISLRVLSRPQASNLPYIYRNLGTDYDERVLPSIVNEVGCSSQTI